MTITPAKLDLFVVTLPMTEPFTTSFGTVTARRLVLVKLTDKDGVVGWGEAATLDQPLFNPDFIESVLCVIERVLWPALCRQAPFESPAAFDDSLAFVRGHAFAKAALSMAAYDIAAQKAGQTLAASLGGTVDSFPVSRTLSVPTDRATLLETAARFVQGGYRELKLKIAPGADLLYAQALRETYPALPLMLDANAAYAWHPSTVQLFTALDALGFFCIEQPFAWNDFCDHARLQAVIQTPVALDESVTGLHDLEQALTLQACRLLNLKFQRVGGLTESLRLIQLAHAHQIGIWTGGMLEGPLGLATVMALSQRPEMTHPADFVDSLFLIQDFQGFFATQPCLLADGKLTPQYSTPGLGLGVDTARLCHAPLYANNLSFMT